MFAKLLPKILPSKVVYWLAKQRWRRMDVVSTDTELRIGGRQVMQDWEAPLMQVMAREVTRTHGDVLELGFGMGISATAIVGFGCRSYTVIEASPKVAAAARTWAGRQQVKVEVVEGFWQDRIKGLGRRFDGIFFDTYPLTADESGKGHYAFIPEAPALLKPGGVFTYYSNETTRFKPDHLALLFCYFDEVKLINVTGLQPPLGCDYWKADHMLVPIASLARDVPHAART